MTGEHKGCSQGLELLPSPKPKQATFKAHGKAQPRLQPEDSLSYCSPCLCSHLPRRVGGYVHPSLCSVEPEDAQVPMRTMCQEHRHRPIQGHGIVQLILEHIQIVEAIRLSTPAGRQTDWPQALTHTTPTPQTQVRDKNWPSCPFSRKNFPEKKQFSNCQR